MSAHQILNILRCYNVICQNMKSSVSSIICVLYVSSQCVDLPYIKSWIMYQIYNAHWSVYTDLHQWYVVYDLVQHIKYELDNTTLHSILCVNSITIFSDSHSILQVNQIHTQCWVWKICCPIKTRYSVRKNEFYNSHSTTQQMRCAFLMSVHI